MKLAKWSVLLVIAMSMVLVGTYTVFAGCSVGQGEEPIPLDGGNGALGTIKGVVTIQYEEVEGNPWQCDLGSTNMSVFGRLRSVVGEEKSEFQPVSAHFPYAKKTDEGIAEGICFEDINTQKALLMGWAKEALVPLFFPNLNLEDIELGLKKAKNPVQTELGSTEYNPLPFAKPFGMFNVVITVDPLAL